MSIFADVSDSYICTTHQSVAASEKFYHLHLTSCSAENLLYQDLKLIKGWFHSQFKNTPADSFCCILNDVWSESGVSKFTANPWLDLWLFYSVMTYFNDEISAQNLQILFLHVRSWLQVCLQWACRSLEIFLQ